MANFRSVAGDDPTGPRHRVLAALRDRGPMSRADLARDAALAPSTITGIVKVLLDEGAVTEDSPEARGRAGVGRRGLRVTSDLALVVGIDFGFRTVRLLLGDLTGSELARAEARLPDHYSAAEGLRAARALLDEALAESGLDRSRLDAAGVALPGPIDPTRQRVVGSAVLPGWVGVTAEDIGVALGVPSVIENDANLAALGEHVYGAGRAARDSITIKFHSGIGAGIIVRDELVSGRSGGAGEIGHTPVDARGPLCRCGKRGCLDTYAAVPAVLGAMASVHPGIDFPSFIALLDGGDPGAERIARDAADLVGQAVATACLLLAPECVVVVGAMARGGEPVLSAVRDAIGRAAIPENPIIPEVVPGALGDRHTAMGAMALALNGLGWLPAATRGI